MPRGSGFVHLNTPASISYSPGQQVSLSDLRQSRNREECVLLPHTIALWRTAFRNYVKMEGFTQFVGDIEAEREGEGPVLPPLAPPPPPPPPTTTNTTKQENNQNNSKCTSSSSSFLPTEIINSSSNTNSGVMSDNNNNYNNTSKSETKEGGIVIVSHHKLSGAQRFVYPDYDGVLSNGIVPQVVISAEEKAELEADRKYYITPLDLSEEERAALEELQSLWKSSAQSRSASGAKHRAVTNNTEISEINRESKEEENNNNNNNNNVKRSRFETNTDNMTNDIQDNTGDILDDALRLAGELLELY